MTIISSTMLLYVSRWALFFGFRSWRRLILRKTSPEKLCLCERDTLPDALVEAYACRQKVLPAQRHANLHLRLVDGVVAAS